jgi:myo-inositol-1(or 4)-monophosphatase
MDNKKIISELALAKVAAGKAGKYLIDNKEILNTSIFSSNTDIKLKADIESEKVIKEFIASNSKHPILAEESGKSVTNLGDTFWVIDPLDGSANYSRNLPICCVSIALIYKFKPVLGVIYDFNNQDLYEGSQSTNACLNSKKISVSDISDKSKGILLTGLPNSTDFSDSSLIEYVKDFQNWRKVRMIGSAAMAAAFVASGKVDVYKEKGTFLWDVAAGAAILNAAGGNASIINQKENFQVDVFFSNSKIVDNT